MFSNISPKTNPTVRNRSKMANMGRGDGAKVNSCSKLWGTPQIGRMLRDVICPYRTHAPRRDWSHFIAEKIHSAKWFCVVLFDIKRPRWIFSLF